jgi:hypothetical protein
MSSIFGGSKSKETTRQQSFNQAYPFIQQQFGGLTGAAGTGTNAMQALLSGDTSGFNAFKNATGFNAMAEQGSRGITGNAAAGGLLRSGSTGKALQSFGNNIQNQFADKYLGHQQNIANMGMNAGQLIAGAGQRSEGSTDKNASEKPGIGKFLGTVASGFAASDPRLKEQEKHVFTLPDGLKVYEFKYKGTDGKHIGVMADEVAKLRPEALGPLTADGFMTVNYDLIWSN